MKGFLLLILIIGAAILFLGFYTVVLYDGGVTVVKKDAFSLSQPFENMKEWKAKDYLENLKLMDRMAKQKKYKALPAGETLNNLFNSGQDGADKVKDFFDDLNKKYDLENKFADAMENIKEKSADLLKDAKEGIGNMIDQQ